MRFLPLFLVCCLMLSACQPIVAPAPAATANNSVSSDDSATGTAQNTSQRHMTDRPARLSAMPPFVADTLHPFAEVDHITWQPASESGIGYSLPLDLGQIANAPVIGGLTNKQQSFLSNNGFVVLETHDQQFSDIRRRVSSEYGQPYYLTTDAAYHVLHVTFDKLLAALEKEYLHPQMIAVVQAALDEAVTYLPQAADTEIEEDTAQAVAYLAVALRLLDPEATLDSEFEAQIAPQIDQVLAGQPREKSVLFPDFEDDYSAYKPVSHYAGDPALENYFRGMTWLGRVHFKLQSADPAFRPSRLPLLITLALRRAPLGADVAASSWVQIHEILTFLIGESDDAGPPQYASLMDSVYGPHAGILDLADPLLWQEFLDSSSMLPAPQLNSTFAVSLREMDAERGWRFLGQRFTLDAQIMQQLVFDKVSTQQDPRLLPSGLDVMAVLGSDAAHHTLVETGTTAYANYPSQLAKMQLLVAGQSEDEWDGTFYSGWLNAFRAQIEAKDAPYPAYMQTDAWGFKDLNSALGSWAELKHDTILYTKPSMAGGGGGPPLSAAAPGYVEPNPLVFFQLAYYHPSAG